MTPFEAVRPSFDGEENCPRRAALTGLVLAGKWRLGELLGTGGMSSVYAATHRNGKELAAKVLRPELSGHAPSVRRFLREGYIANLLDHDGVVDILDDGVTDEGVPYLLMDRLHGTTVDQYCKSCGGALPANEVLSIADAILDILVVAHEKGIVHRDIKPSNLFLTRNGKVKLLDFGIASVERLPGVTGPVREGAVLGTPGFMSPEQAAGKWDQIDPRSDLWAVGAVMFRLLTGRFVQETAEIVDGGSASIDSASALEKVAPLLPRGVVILLDRALRYSMEDRWPSAREMMAEVRSLRRSLPRCQYALAPDPSLQTIDETPRPVNEVGAVARPGPAGRGRRQAMSGAMWHWLLASGLAVGACAAVIGRRTVLDGQGCEHVETATSVAPALVSPVASAPSTVHEVIGASSAPSTAIPIAVQRRPTDANAQRRAAKAEPSRGGPSKVPSPRIRFEDVLDERR